MPRQPLWVAGGLALFVVVATLNSGGYRYGASDQAFYIPAILKQLDPSLYPRDTALFGPQARYFLVDEMAAAAIRVTGWRLETWFAVGYLVSLALLFGALWGFGHALYRWPGAVWALLAAETLRHRVTKTGVNTLEGYFHPRVLVFAVGVGAVAAYVRGRPWLALVAVLLSGLMHPSTAAFFLLFLAAAIWITEPRARRVVGGVVTAATVGAAWLLLAGPLRGALAPMDVEWRAVLATKDYLFPTRDWPLAAWAANLATAALAIGILAARTARGEGHPRERGLLAGAVLLLAGFLLTLPAVAAGSALFVQLQITRVFWILDLLAAAMAIAWLLDTRADDGAARRRWRQAATAAIVALAVARAGWVALVERDARPIVAWTLEDEDWTRVLAWASRQPARVHLLAHPGHTWLYGTPLRYAGRDVFLEEMKDTAMALYDRDAASRVARRFEAIGDFDTLDAARARSLAATFRLDYLVIDRELDLPLAHREGRFSIYRLR